MFALGIRYLTGTAVQATPGDLANPEWPPHPARVFMAMVAAWAETGQAEAEADALRWIESLGSPSGIFASPASERTSRERFVPVNDSVPSTATEVKKAGVLQSAPAFTRVRSPRYFPTVRPEDDRVFLIWKAELVPQHRRALEVLCGRVSRIGHSSSLVQMWLEMSPPSATWQRSDDRPEQRLRGIEPGLLDQLLAAAESTPRRRPSVSFSAGYEPVGEPARVVDGSHWDENLVVMALKPLESGFRRLDLVSTLQLTARLHAAAVSRAEEPVPEVLSGHRSDGSPTEVPHMAFLPLPFTGHPHADGELRGIALALPRGTPRDLRRAILRTVARVGDPGADGKEGLKLGVLGRWELASVMQDPLPETLRDRTWTAAPRGASVWASVTPVAFDRHPKTDGATYQRDVARMMVDACRWAGLPEPVHVQPMAISVHSGVPASHEFPRMRRKDGSQRRHLHARLVFAEPVRGPVAIGAGRFRGYGLFRPVRGGPLR